MNVCVIIGRLARDPEQRFTTSGTAVTTFTLAVNRIDKTADFIRIKAFGKTAELVSMYLKKGSQAAITGRIQTGSYENSEGQKVYTTDIIADRVEFLSSRSETAKNEAAQESEDDLPTEFESVEEDVPF